MERKNIAFQYGIHRSPSAANEGELSECINLEVHNGEITPSVMPEVAFTLSEGDKLLFVHKSGNYKNFIIQRGSNLCWFPDEDKDSVSTIGEITPKSIHSVGNTLVVLSENSMEYILFKSGNYKRIGSKPPFCSISFGLAGGYEFRTSSFTIEGSGAASTIDASGFIGGLEAYFKDGTIPEDVSFEYLKDSIETGSDSYLPMYTEFVNKMTECGLGMVNDLISDRSKLGSFTNSFYVRYAYRMYDGSHYLQSAPIFMPVSTFGPVLSPSYIEEKDANHTIGMNLAMPSSSLNFKIIGFYNEEGNKVDAGAIVDWDDIVKGVDIFVSKPLYIHKQDGYVLGYTSKTDEMHTSLSLTGKRNTITSGDLEDLFKEIYKNHTYSDLGIIRDVIFTIEKDDEYQSKIESVSLFYKVSELNGVGYLSASSGLLRSFVDIKDDVLNSLEQQEVLEDDYDSHNKIIPSFAHVYNGRLNISGIRSKIFNGYPMESMVPYTYDPEENNYFWYIQTKLDVEGREITVVSESNVQLREKPAFIYYPNANVTEFTLNRYNGESGDPGFTTLTYYFAKFAAEKHKLLNGSFYLSTTFGVGDSYTLITSSGSPEPSGDPYIEYPNKIYTSEVNNPFFFPLSGRNSIGTGEIVAITSNTKAISPGQFGEYPLIVFSTDGVWAMQTGEEGLYYGVHPISKDICINPNILQTDGPVLFVTDNGLHSIVSDSVENISRIIKGKPDNINIPAVDDKFTLLSTISEDADTFNEFIRIAVFAFDYVNRRVIMSHPDKPFAYVYSMDSGMFSKMVILKEGNPVILGGAINAYPEIYMQSGTDIYTFVADKDSVEELSHGLLVTRPLVFSDPLAMKVVNDLRLIYHKTKEGTRCRYAMLVSNDGRTWKQRGSLRGHSFKYFRFAVYSELSDTDALQGMSIMYDYRRTNKLR